MARSFAKSPNGKELITINYDGATCALYQEEYLYGGVALFLYDLTNDELWGDLTINLPGYFGMYLQDFISDDVVNKLKRVFTVDGKVRCNYGTYRSIDISDEMLDKIPTWDELVELVQG